MAGEALPIIQRLAQIVRENPAALRELAPVASEGAFPTEQLSGPDLTDLLTRAKGAVADLLASGRSEYSASRPAASLLRSGPPTAPSPGVQGSTSAAQRPIGIPPERTTGQFDEAIKQGGGIPAGIQKGDPSINLQDLVLFHHPETGSTMALPTDRVTPENVRARLSGRASSPARPVQMDIMDRLPGFGGPSTRTEGLDESADIPQTPTPNPGGPPTMVQGPSMYGAGEALRRPLAGERGDIVRQYLQAAQSGDADTLKNLRPQLQPPAKTLPPEVKAGLGRMGGLPAEPEPQPSEDFPVTRIPYRGAPRVEAMSPSFADRLKTEGLKKSNLPPEAQQFLEGLVNSGQLPQDIMGQEGTIRNLLAQSYGYKPRALLGGQKQIGEASSSRIGLALKKFSNLSPEEITRILQSVKPSGIYRLGKIQSAAEAAAPLYQALGESGSAEDIVKELLRGGPSPMGQGEFSQKVLYPILKRRSRLGLQQGEPLTLENVLGALKSSGFVRSNRPSPVREAFLAKVLQMVKERGGK